MGDVNVVCPHCGDAFDVQNELIDPNVGGDGGELRAYHAVCGDCGAEGPTRNSEPEATTAFADPAHALATAQKELTTLRAALAPFARFAAVLPEERGGNICAYEGALGKAEITCEHVRTASAAIGGAA